MDQTEEELERFRKQWKEEVTAKKRQNRASTELALTQPSSSSSAQKKPAYPHSAARRNRYDDELEPRTYHDLEEKELGRKVGDDSYGTSSSNPRSEPRSALEHYERAVEKEGQGNLGESMIHYRKAFKLDDRVHEKYKNKHFPPTKPTNPTGSQAHASDTTQTSQLALPPSISDLISDFSQLSIPGAPPPTELSPPPPCPISRMPDEILVEILGHFGDVASFVHVAQVCKRLAFLVFTEDRLWRRFALGDKYGFAAMHYQYACNIDGSDILQGDSDNEDEFAVVDSSPLLSKPIESRRTLPLSAAYPTYRQMFRSRPRIRFNGCYISTVNYTRPGAVSPNHLTWNSPILIVTYYRYLRFFRDGTVISLLTTTEPADVVPYLHKENLQYQRQPGGNLPQMVMKDALKGRWRLSGDPYGTKKTKGKRPELEGTEEEEEVEGDVLIETDGVVPKYIYKMQLALGSARRATPNNRLSWKGFWSYNKLTDDWGEFVMKNYRPFYWSRVISYGSAI